MKFEEIYPKYKNLIRYRLLIVAHRKDIKDIFQDVLIRIFKGCKHIRNPKAVKAWLQVVVRSVLTDRFRKEGVGSKLYSLEPEDEELLEEIHNKLVEMKEPSNLYEEKITASKVLEALDQVPEPYRTPFKLRFVHDLSYEEIAEKTGTELGTVKSRVYRGRARFEELYTGDLVGLSKPIRSKN